MLLGVWCHLLQVHSDIVFSSWHQSALNFHSDLCMVCTKVVQPGSCLVMSLWPLCTTSATGAEMQCFDTYCPMRVPNSKSFMVQLNCSNTDDSFWYSMEYPLGSVLSLCTSLCLPTMHYHELPYILLHYFFTSLMGWKGFHMISLNCYITYAKLCIWQNAGLFQAST